MNDADRATATFVGFIIAGVLIGGFLFMVNVWPFNWLFLAIAVSALFVTGYSRPRVFHYSHALIEWQKTQDMHTMNLVWVVVAVCVCSAFLVMLLTTPSTVALLIMLAGVSTIFIGIAHPANRRYITAVGDFDRTYHYETAVTAETGGATGC